MNKVELTGPSSCVVCSMAYGGVCLGCRTERLIRDIRSKEVDHTSADSNRFEWEERCLKAEKRLEKSEAIAKGLADAGEAFLLISVVTPQEVIDAKKATAKVLTDYNKATGDK